MAEHPDTVARRAMDGLWEAIRERHPELPPVAVAPLDMSDHHGVFIPPGPHSSEVAIFVDRGTVDEGPHGVLRTLLHEAAHVLLHARGAWTPESGTRKYHSPLFRDAAIVMGLTPPKEADPVLGYSACELPPETADSYRDALLRYHEVMSA